MNKCRPSQKGHSINSLRLHPYFKFYKLQVAYISILHVYVYTGNGSETHVVKKSLSTYLYLPTYMICTANCYIGKLQFI